MEIKRIDHYSIRTLDVEASRKFYTDVIGLTVGPRPEFKFPGLWLYNGKPPADLEHSNGNYGIVHVMGSDGHSPRRRRPQMADAYRRIAGWAGAVVADRVCSTNATAVIHNLPLHLPEPEPRRARWFARLW